VVEEDAVSPKGLNNPTALGESKAFYCSLSILAAWGVLDGVSRGARIEGNFFFAPR
jgi:hypothetical protein